MVKMNEKKTASCGTCFFNIENKNPMAIGQTSGECRRFPPSIIMIQGRPVLIWPTVNNDSRLFCGEWKERNVE